MSEPTLQSKGQSWLRDNALAVLDSVVDAILTIDSDGIIQSINRATSDMFGFESDELVGHPIAKLMPEPFRSQHQGFIAHYLKTGNAKIIGFGRELTAVGKDGRGFPVYLAVSEIFDGTDRYFAGIIRDMSEQKAAQTALLEHQQRLAHVGRLSTMGEMTASIAHEINQPLTAIAMYAQAGLRLLGSDVLDRAKLTDAIDKLSQQSLRAGAVIERIQRFVSDEGGHREQVAINALVMELEHLAAIDARMYGIELEFGLQTGLPSVFCDPIQIQQVLLNLIRNAIDAMQEIDCDNGNLVHIHTRAVDENRVEVAVIDSGIGVAKDQLDLVFDAFHTTKHDGMGMGLSICRSIIEEHGGQLEFRNNDDHGCTFFFRIPTGDDNE